MISIINTVIIPKGKKGDFFHGNHSVNLTIRFRIFTLDNSYKNNVRLMNISSEIRFLKIIRKFQEQCQLSLVS